MGSNGSNLASGIPWMKGRMRPEIEASKCLHLDVSHYVRFHQRRSGVTNAEGQKIATFTMDPKESEIYLSCVSEALLAQIREQSKLPPVLDQEVTKLRVSLEICRMCPFWEKAQ